MPLGDPPRHFPIDGPFTVADLIAIADQLRDAPPDHEVRVLTRVGMSRAGSAVRQVNIVPPTRPGNGATTTPTTTEE